MSSRSEPMYHALVDLFMLLLLIFSGREIAVSQQQPDVEIVAPGKYVEQHKMDTPGDDIKRLNLLLAPDGQMLIDNKPISLTDLVAKARTEQIPKVFLQVDKSVTYTKVLEVIRQLDKEGLTVELG